MDANLITLNFILYPITRSFDVVGLTYKLGNYQNIRQESARENEAASMPQLKYFRRLTSEAWSKTAAINLRNICPRGSAKCQGIVGFEAPN